MGGPPSAAREGGNRLRRDPTLRKRSETATDAPLPCRAPDPQDGLTWPCQPPPPPQHAFVSRIFALRFTQRRLCLAGFPQLTWPGPPPTKGGGTAGREVPGLAPLAEPFPQRYQRQPQSDGSGCSASVRKTLVPPSSFQATSVNGLRSNIVTSAVQASVSRSGGRYVWR